MRLAALVCGLRLGQGELWRCKSRRGGTRVSNNNQGSDERCPELVPLVRGEAVEPRRLFDLIVALRMSPLAHFRSGLTSTRKVGLTSRVMDSWNLRELLPGNPERFFHLSLALDVALMVAVRVALERVVPRRKPLALRSCLLALLVASEIIVLVIGHESAIQCHRIALELVKRGLLVTSVRALHGPFLRHEILANTSRL